MKNPILRSLQKPILLIFLFFSLVSVVNAQDDVEVDVTNVIYYLDGTVSNGSIHFLKNIAGVVYVEVVSAPIGDVSGPCVTSPFTLDDVFVGNLIVVSPSCVGEWCFKMTKDNDTECIVEFCVTVGECREVRLKDGWDYTEIKCDEKFNPFPPDDPKYGLVTTGGNENAVTKNGKAKKYFSKEIKDVELKKVYPNPFINELSINLDATKESEINIRLVDLLGKIVFEKSKKVYKGDNLLELNLENTLPSGSYILTISNTEGVHFSKKLIHF